MEPIFLFEESEIMALVSLSNSIVLISTEHGLLQGQPQFLIYWNFIHPGDDSKSCRAWLEHKLKKNQIQRGRQGVSFIINPFLMGLNTQKDKYRQTPLSRFA